MPKINLRQLRRSSTLWLVMLAVGWDQGATPSLADAPVYVYGLSATGVLYKFDKATGVATEVRTLSVPGCGIFGGLTFVNNHFYTSCSGGSAYIGKLISFGFHSGDEVVLDTLSWGGANYTTFTQIIPDDSDPALLKIHALPVNWPGNVDVMTYDLRDKTQTPKGRTSDQPNLPLCGSSYDNTTSIVFLEWNGGGTGTSLLALASVYGNHSGTWGGWAIGKVSSDGSCYQVECMLTDYYSNILSTPAAIQMAAGVLNMLL